jgi:hypothetical protein
MKGVTGDALRFTPTYCILTKLRNVRCSSNVLLVMYMWEILGVLRSTVLLVLKR